MSNKITIALVVVIIAALAGLFIWKASEPRTDTYGYGETQGSKDGSTPGSITFNSSNMRATLHTNKGDIVLEFSADTPNTVANFQKLAKEGFYNGTKFHRVIKGFMIQGGDPLSKDDSQMARWGTGGPGYQFADEISPTNRNAAGTIAMANAGPNTNGSQFFINVVDNNYLDARHTVFARVIAGMDVAMAIASSPTGPNDRPTEPIVIESVTLE
jgi:peptidylprolyl isomerase